MYRNANNNTATVEPQCIAVLQNMLSVTPPHWLSAICNTAPAAVGMLSQSWETLKTAVGMLSQSWDAFCAKISIQ
jgi:hypothetical protein